MTAYGRDIPEIVAWTMPQLRMLSRYRDIRERNERRWQLSLAIGAQSQEGAESLYEQLDGSASDEEGEYTVVAQGGTSGSSGSSDGSGKGHRVDSKGNVKAQGAPLLSDIAMGKARAPQLIPIRVINKSAPKEEDA